MGKVGERGRKDDGREFGQKMELNYDDLDLFDSGNAPLPPPPPPAHAKFLCLWRVTLRMTSLMVAMRLWELCIGVGSHSLGGER